MIKFIADVNIERPIVDFMQKKGYDVKWVPDYDCEISDEELLRLANEEKRILLTNDKDFGGLVYLQRRLSSGILLFRVKGQVSEEKVRLLEKVLERHGDRLSNHFTVIGTKKIRIVPMEDMT